MADSFNKKERQKKKQKRRKEKAEKREMKKSEGKSEIEFMYVDEFGNLTATKPDPNERTVIKAEDIDLSSGGGIKESAESKFMKKGTVKFFNTEKGYGFITDKLTKMSIFVHAENLIDEIKDNDRVKFEMGKGPKGPVAIKVQLDKQQP